MEIESLKPFALVGGTALSLKYGHRISIDLDLFYNQKFDNKTIANALSESFGPAFDYKPQHEYFGIFCYISGVKTDLVHYPHPLIQPIEEKEGVRMYSDADLIAMKIQAILGRGRRKDFYDLYELLQHYELNRIIDWHRQKFPNQMLAISIPHAMTYFTDADDDASPKSLKGMSWEEVKSGISGIVRDFLS
jgi:predicted nucleotidyltransferase component of viral defense system